LTNKIALPYIFIYWKDFYPAPYGHRKEESIPVIVTLNLMPRNRASEGP